MGREPTIRTRMVVLSERRESKDLSSPFAPLFPCAYNNQIHYPTRMVVLPARCGGSERIESKLACCKQGKDLSSRLASTLCFHALTTIKYPTPFISKFLQQCPGVYPSTGETNDHYHYRHRFHHASTGRRASRLALQLFLRERQTLSFPRIARRFLYSALPFRSAPASQ